MTIASETNRSGPYNCNGATTSFPYTFKIYDESHIRVVLTSPTGSETSLALGPGYVVSGVGEDAGGSITTGETYPAGYTITIVLNVPNKQEVDLENQGAFFAETVEKSLDLLTQQILQIKEMVTRSFLLPVAYTAGVTIDPTTLQDIAGNADLVKGYKDAAAVSAAEAAASAEAAALWNPASYSTTAQIEAMLADYPLASEVTAALADYTPKTRKLIAGEGITINGTTEATLGGDVTIAAVPTDTGVPIGGYLFYPSTKTPTGRWIAGNGAAISRTTYADLDTAMYVGDSANATEPAWYRCTDPANPSTSRSTTGAYIVLPDLRGLAPRFLDDGRGYDPSRAVNTYQSDLIGSHSHTVVSGGVVNAPSLQASSTSAGATYSTSAAGGAETRMKNISARGWIKY